MTRRRRFLLLGAGDLTPPSGFAFVTLNNRLVTLNGRPLILEV